MVLMLASSRSFSEGRPYTFRHYTGENGLPQNSVGAISLDREGFVWLATSNGLVRFDGRSFLTFDKGALRVPTNQFLGFVQDSDYLYALASDFSYVKMDGGNAVVDKHPSFAMLRKMIRTREGLHDLTYAMGFPDRFNETWFPSRSAPHSIGNWFPAHYVFFIPGSNGNFFKWQRNGQVDYYANWKKLKSYPTQVRMPHGIFRIGNCLYNDDRAGNIELLVASDSARTPGRVKLIPAQGHNVGPDLSKPYFVYSQDLVGETFIYQNRKLYLLSQRGSRVLETSVLLDDFDFQRNNVASVFYDHKHQRVYLGTLSNGLFIVDFQAFRTLTIDSNEPTANIYYAQVAFSDSTVITPSFSVLGIGNEGQIVANRLPPPVIEFPMTWKSIVRARSGDIWCLKSNILFRFDRYGQKLKGTWDAGGEISHLFEDDAGRVWLGTRERGLLYIDPSENETLVLHAFTTKIKGITYIQQQGRDILWVGTDKGLYRINLSRKTFLQIANTSQYYVRSILVQKNGKLWFTTYEHGFLLYEGNTLTRFPLDKNRYLASAHCLIVDKSGYFWLSTNHGLFRIHGKDLIDFKMRGDSTGLYYHHYLKRDGFRIDEFNGGCQPCAVRLRNGYVSLPSIDGLVFFKPEEIPADLPDSRIFVDRIEAGSKRIPVNASSARLTDVSDIRVFVSSPYLGNRENQQLYYSVSSDRRSEAKPIWYPVENEQQSIHLNNLESGTYVLKIRKNGGFGPHSERLTTLTLIIPYAWYETWPFKVLVLALLLAAIFYYYKTRLKKADRLNRILESRVSEKTRNLQDTLSVLKASEQQLLRQTRLQMHLIASISHDIRSPLRSIEFTSARLGGIIDDGDIKLAKTVGSSVNESTRKILSLLENMLSYVKSQVSGDVVAYEIFPARALTDEVAHIFKEAFAVQQNHFENHVPETLQIRSNRQLLKIILHNLIDNANKYTSDGVVKVSGIQEGQAIRLVVSDTGPGLSKDLLSWINESNAAYPEAQDGKPGVHGIGLVIVRELIEILGLEISAIAHHGTQFSILLSAAV